MPLAVEDLIQPAGELEPNLFSASDPGGDTEARVTVWLVEAEAQAASVPSADRDAATAQWVYWRAYNSKYRQLLAQPASEDVGEGSRQYLISQIRAFEEMAAAAKAEFNGYVVTVEAPSSPPSTVSVPKWIVW
jgi:uncharacterized protein YfaP (DUF2135 family)